MYFGKRKRLSLRSKDVWTAHAPIIESYNLNEQHQDNALKYGLI